MGNYGQVQIKPRAAYIMSMIGGVLGFLISMFLVSNGNLLYMWSFATCLVIVLAAQKLNAQPMEHTKWGLIILIFSIISLTGLLSSIGGILALVYKPPFTAPPQQNWNQQFTPQQNPSPQSGTQVCTQCGQVTDANARFCPDCGGPTVLKPPVQPPSQPPQAQTYGPQFLGGAPSQFCGNCGSKLAPGARFCAECGQPTQ
jgi:RNA polymerase subunit RPABC4/transcription elongation factor Spt4